MINVMKEIRQGHVVERSLGPQGGESLDKKMRGSILGGESLEIRRSHKAENSCGQFSMQREQHMKRLGTCLACWRSQRKTGVCTLCNKPQGGERRWDGRDLRGQSTWGLQTMSRRLDFVHSFTERLLCSRHFTDTLSLNLRVTTQGPCHDRHVIDEDDTMQRGYRMCSISHSKGQSWDLNPHLSDCKARAANHCTTLGRRLGF